MNARRSSQALYRHKVVKDATAKAKFIGRIPVSAAVGSDRATTAMVREVMTLTGGSHTLAIARTRAHGELLSQGSHESEIHPTT
jgi:hypothetical protein